MSVDTPEFRALPKDVRRELLRPMWRQQRQLLFGSLVLVRAWQQSSPKTAADADRPAP
ncbi:hypothetical protein [Streptomyces sp. NPDC059816]|uniref:hypothetical protein n=1 Tax=Streptomyces sp. NPDC059816 TaxID=3346960 RepID=UPI0036636491